MINDEIKITLVANEGLLIEHAGVKLLIDALHDKKEGGFSSVSQENLRKMINAEAPFDGVSYLIFTHCHKDHFSADMLLDYLLHNDVEMLFLPDSQTKKFEELRKLIELRKTKVQFLDLPLFEKNSFCLGDGGKLTYFNSVHAGNAYKDVENYCFLLELGGKCLFFLADADYNIDYFDEMLSGASVDTLFVNLLYVNKPVGREIIKKINPACLIVYHIPFEKDDTMHFRYVAQRDLEKYTDILPKTVILQDEMQEIMLR